MKLHTHQRNFMNTVITFKLVQIEESTLDIQRAVEAGFGEFDRIVKKFTRFNEDSELSNLNRNSGKWVKVSEELFYLVETMLDLAHKTNGAFDPTIIDFLEVYGYDKNYNFDKLKNPELSKLVENIAKTRHSFKEIELNKEQSKIKLMPGQRIDLGGIGKGYAIDCAYENINKFCKNFLIDAGGDIRAKGFNQEQKPWSVALRNKIAEKDEIIGYVELKDQAIASSGSWARKVEQFHHLINPRTGKPENQYNTVYVVAKNATLADSWATAIFVGGDKVKKVIPNEVKFYTV